MNLLDKIIKEKRKIGIIAAILILISVSFFIYHKSGYKELSKNNAESIFEEESAEDDNKAKKDNSSDAKNIITVEIKGEVKNPDVYTLNSDSIVRDLIEKAGGTTNNADLKNINRAKKLIDHEVVYIQNSEEAKNCVSASFGVSSGSSLTENGKVNINTADIEGLKKIDGVGDSKAKKIIEYREKNGGFKSIDEIKNISGIGEKTFEKMKRSA